MNPLSLTEIQLQALSQLGIQSLTPMQEATLFACREPQDLILLSPTGSGKTLAYLLPLLEETALDRAPAALNRGEAALNRDEVALNRAEGPLNRGEATPAALIVVPSRELAMQIVTVFQRMRTPWRAMAVYGGRPAMDEHRSMRGVMPSLIVGTPGRLVDHLQKGNISPDQVQTLIIDEFDKCLELGFHDEMQRLISLLPSLQRRRLISATEAVEMPEFVDLHRHVKLDYRTGSLPPAPSKRGGEKPVTKKSSAEVALTRDSASLNRAEGPLNRGEATLTRDEVALNRAEGPLNSPQGTSAVSLWLVPSPDKDKLQTLYHLLCSLDGAQTIVFCNYRESAERISGYLREQRLIHSFYHGGLDQELRERALYKFRSGSVNVLVSTDLAARGLDIPEVQHIVHYHLPLTDDAYIHRTGRTARWNASGNSYLILGPDEQQPAWLATVSPTEPALWPMPTVPRRPAPPVWETLYIGKGKKDKLSRGDIAGFLYKKGGLVKDDVGPIDVYDHYCYVAVRRTKARQLLTLLAGEKIKGLKTLIEIAK